MSDRRMDAYYYSFEPTKVEAVDKILGAVACAGKAFHHTTDWNDEIKNPYDDHTGSTPVEWIQNAAIEAAAEIERLKEEVERLRAALLVARDCIEESFSHAKTPDDLLMAEARLRDVDAALTPSQEPRT